MEPQSVEDSEDREYSQSKSAETKCATVGCDKPVFSRCCCKEHYDFLFPIFTNYVELHVAFNRLRGNDLKSLLPRYNILNQMLQYKRNYRDQGFSVERWFEGKGKILYWIEEEIRAVERMIVEQFDRKLETDCKSLPEQRTKSKRLQEYEAQKLAELEVEYAEFKQMRTNRRLAILKDDLSGLPCLTKATHLDLCNRSRLYDMVQLHLSTACPESANFAFLILIKMTAYAVDSKNNFGTSEPWCIFCHENDIESMMIYNQTSYCCIKRTYLIVISQPLEFYRFCAGAGRKITGRHIHLDFAKDSGDRVRVSVSDDSYLPISDEYTFSVGALAKIWDHETIEVERCKSCLKEIRERLPFGTRH